ncbi:MAG: hypothetical protein EBR82_02825 [Caulobacteraceae bacterium]|nr:hypothetical protein [Caulobacteraceae bacterium]
MLRPYQRAFLSALGAGLSSASYRFVPRVNATLAPGLNAAVDELARRAAERARITRLRRDLLARMALDRERHPAPRMKSIPSA